MASLHSVPLHLFFLLPELLQIRLADRLTFPAMRQQDICPAHLMSIALTNLQICPICFAIMLCIWYVDGSSISYSILSGASNPGEHPLQFSTECESTRHSGLQTGLRCLQKQNISDMTNGSGHYTEKASSRSPIFLWTSNWDGRMGDVLETSLHSYFHKEAFRCLSHKRRRQLRTTLRIRSDSLLAMRHCT